jgi:hypothetical protein
MRDFSNACCKGAHVHIPLTTRGGLGGEGAAVPRCNLRRVIRNDHMLGEDAI